MRVAAIFGPTAVGKTGVAIALAEILRAEGEDPVAVNCDAMQIYRGLEVISAAPTEAERQLLEHRLLGILDPGEEFSAGRYAELAHREIDSLISQGRRPILVGGTGLYLRAALCELELRPPVPEAVRKQVEAELGQHGPAALHRQLPPDLADRVHPNDRKKIGRYLELIRAGQDPPRGSEQLWTERLRRPALMAGLTMDRTVLADRIGRRVERMARDGAAAQAGRAAEHGIGRTAAAMLGFEAFRGGDTERVKLEHRRYARRQVTWMRKMPGVTVVDRTGLEHREVAAKLAEHLLG